MAFHIVLNRPSELDRKAAGARSGDNPRHSMIELAEALDAEVHDGTGLRTNLVDRMVAKVSRTEPLWWAISRDVRKRVGVGDVVFCTGEDVGLPVAMLCGGRHGARVALMAHSIDGPKKRLALRLFRAKSKVSLFTTVCESQAAALRSYLGDRDGRVSFVWDQTDTDFFAPGPVSPTKTRPVVMSVGLERRDYTTLAAATADLEVDVHISGYSADTRLLSRAFPEVLPHNMTRRFYSWAELVQLYRDADIVVVPLFPSDYAAGVQGLMEGLSCGRPVVVTSTVGLREYLEPADAMCVIGAGDAQEMRGAIMALLSSPSEAKALSERALSVATSRHSCDVYVQTLVEKLKALQGVP